MDDMLKEIVFREGWTLDGMPFDDYLKARACEVIALGYRYGLTLVEFRYSQEAVEFHWRGAKKNMLAWYDYQSRSMTYESEENRQKALTTISNK